jgi:hypothetical protein
VHSTQLHTRHSPLTLRCTHSTASRTRLHAYTVALIAYECLIALTACYIQCLSVRVDTRNETMRIADEKHKHTPPQEQRETRTAHHSPSHRIDSRSYTISQRHSSPHSTCSCTACVSHSPNGQPPTRTHQTQERRATQLTCFRTRLNCAQSTAHSSVNSSPHCRPLSNRHRSSLANACSSPTSTLLSTQQQPTHYSTQCANQR